MAAYGMPRPGGRVLDPACGAGALVAAAFDLGAGPCVGVDLDLDAVAVARGALGERARIVHGDFLDTEPEDLGGRFDAVLANPPYLRHEAISGPRKARLQRRFADEIGERIGGRLDLLGYFLIHLTRFLRPGGRLAFLSSAAWLTSGYGAVLRRFLARNYRIDQVLESVAEPWFSEARVRGALVLARREAPVPAGHAVVFRRLERPEVDLTTHDGQAVEQQRLDTGDSWGPHLRTPALLRELREARPRIWSPLGCHARVRFGIKTGADRFFVFRDGVDGHGRPWSGPPDALKPFVLSPMELDRLDIDPDRLRRRLLVLEPADRTDPAVAEHVAAGEERGLHRRPTCAARKGAWCCLVPPPPPPVVWTRTVQYRHLVAANPGGALINNNLLCLWPREPTTTRALLVSLNSAWTHLERQACGRVSNEGKVKTEVGDLPDMAVLDPARLAGVSLDPLRGRPLVDLATEMDHPSRREFEEAVLTALGSSASESRDWVERLAHAVQGLDAAERRWERLYRARRNRRPGKNVTGPGCSPANEPDGEPR
jgi:SAM-dependent methyltransferase